MLEVKKKHLDRREWYNDSERDFTCIYHKDDFFDGGIGLITFTGIREPEEIDTDEGKLCIADKGYQWLEIVPRNGHYALTAMFRERQLFQIYIDITSRNEVYENGDAVFYDIFLDVVICSSGLPEMVDKNELEEALSQGIITRYEYDCAFKNADAVVDLYRKNQDLLRQKMYEYLALFSE